MNVSDTSTKKPTKKENFNALLPLLVNEDGTPNDELVAFVKHEIDLLSKKAAAKSGKTKTQIENESIKDEIVDGLVEAGVPVTATDVGNLIDQTVQKASALLRQLVEDGRVLRDDSGKSALFTAAPEVDSE